MIDISFEVGGKKVSSNNLGGALEKAMFDEVSKGIKKTLSSVRCGEHGRYPKVEVKGRNIDNLSFQIDGCCQPLIDKATAKLK
ncbi:MAG: hypothetical protein ABFS32_17330 [Bacteroidota bacterium]